MIVVNKIFKDGAFSPENVPKPNKGSYFNGDKFYFAENDEDLVTIAQMQPVVPDEQKKVKGAALQALLDATPEELDEIKKILGLK